MFCLYNFVEYSEEIEDSVLNGIRSRSRIISDIIDEFNYRVAKYGS